jgi:hypothetical protein
VRLFGNVAEPPFELDGIFLDVHAVKENLTLGSLDQAGEHFDSGALSGAVGSEVAENLARSDRKTYVVDNRNAAVALGKRPDFQQSSWTPYTSSKFPPPRNFAQLPIV